MNILFNKGYKAVAKGVYENSEKTLGFQGKLGNVLPYLNDDKVEILFGLGKKGELDRNKIKKLFFDVYKEFNKYQIEEFSVDFNSFSDKKEDVVDAFEGLVQATYYFDNYLSEKKKYHVKNVSFEGDLEKLKTKIDERQKVLDGVFLTRKLVNLSAIDLYPEVLANEAKKELEPLGIEVKVYNKEEIKKMGMHAFLAVAEGSDKEPRFIVMHYKGSEETPIALVGKGVTYDSGGYSIKPADGMATMHCDMAGSATVIGTMKALALNGVKKNVYAVVAACENLIDGSAYKTGDIISSLSGKSIEVANTDAEGRLTLADALYYTVTNIKPKYVIDIATLTGAMMVGLGLDYTGALFNDNDLVNNVIEASKEMGEYVWAMPSDKFFNEYNKSQRADIKNIGGRWAGGITAGMFLSNFVEDTKWVHLDIAGPAYYSEPKGYYPIGATGIMVKTLYQTILND